MSTLVAGLERIQDLLNERGLSAGDGAARLLARAETNASEDELEEFFGHGPLRALLNDETVTEILVNGPEEIWFEKAGSLRAHPGKFSGEESLRRYVRRILAPQARKVDPRAPFADAILADGVRVHVAVPPVAKRGICLSLRKPARDPWTLTRLQEVGALDAKGADLLRQLVAAKKNIFVCGGTGTGKTSLLSAFLHEVDAGERILALEDVAEIRVCHPHFLSLEARSANQEGEGEISLTRLLREALRMRPDRLVIGECRGTEALDLLMALNTGHKGSFGTIHANSARDALHRLETLALLAAENLRESALRNLIASAVQVVVFLERTEGGRKIASLAEVRGVDGGNYLLKETKLS